MFGKWQPCISDFHSAAKLFIAAKLEEHTETDWGRLLTETVRSLSLKSAPIVLLYVLVYFFSTNRDSTDVLPTPAAAQPEKHATQDKNEKSDDARYKPN